MRIPKLALLLAIFAGSATAGEHTRPDDVVDFVSSQPVAATDIAAEGDLAAETSEFLSSACDDDSCAGCGGCCQGHCRWFKADYLLWWTKGMHVPSLATTSPDGTARADAGVLGTTGVETLYGNGDILNSDRSGARVIAGAYLDPWCIWGLEGEYLQLNSDQESFSASSDAAGNPILARPFFNANPTDINGNPTPPARQDSELVAFPGVLQGTVSVEADTRFESAGVRFRRNLMCCFETVPSFCAASNSCRLDLLMGYRYLQLNDHLRITEDLTSLDTAAPGDFDIFDQFDADNQFNGAEIGVMWDIQRGPFRYEILGKLAFGNNRQSVTIDGETTISNMGLSQTFDGGLLAQSSNMGTFTRDRFTVIPELGINTKWQITQRLHASIGYSLIYVNRVVRSGHHIDLNVNPDLLPPAANPVTGPLVPAFAFNETDFWAQGLNFGLEYRW